MKKSFIRSALLLVLSGALVSCGSSERPGSGVAMTARVTALSEKLEVEVIESPYTFGVHLVITDSAEVYDKEGNRITVDGISIGDKVEILYSGQIMLSYPPQIVAAKITVIKE